MARREFSSVGVSTLDPQDAKRIAGLLRAGSLSVGLLRIDLLLRFDLIDWASDQETKQDTEWAEGGQ